MTEPIVSFWDNIHLAAHFQPRCLINIAVGKRLDCSLQTHRLWCMPLYETEIEWWTTRNNVETQRQRLHGFRCCIEITISSNNRWLDASVFLAQHPKIAICILRSRAAPKISHLNLYIAKANGRNGFGRCPSAEMIDFGFLVRVGAAFGADRWRLRLVVTESASTGFLFKSGFFL